MQNSVARTSDFPHKTQMYKEQIFLNRPEPQPISRLSDFFQSRSLLPAAPEQDESIKDPIDPETNDFSPLTRSLEQEYKTFEKLANNKSAKSALIEKSWFLQWKNYLHGGRFPGIIKTSALVDQFGRVRISESRLYIKVTLDQFFFLKDIYCAQGLVEVDSANKPNKRNLSVCESNENIFPTVNEPEGDLVTLMDENFCKTEPKNSETDTVPELSMKFFKKRFGLENPAFFCYLNSVLQCFLTIPEMVNYFLGLVESPDPKSESWTYQVYSLVYAAIRSESKTIRPVTLWKEVTKIFSPAQQHDFFDFWRYLLQQLEKENGKENIFSDIFSGKLKSRLFCRVCQKESTNFEFFSDLSLEFSPILKKSLQKFCSSEKIKCFCETCGQKTKHLKSYSIETSPKILVIQIKRFKNQNSVTKIADFCTFKKYLKVKTQAGNERYNLIAIAEHKGSINYGHYNAYCKRHSKWFKFNDRKFYKIPFTRVLKKKLYCAVFEKQLEHF